MKALTPEIFENSRLLYEEAYTVLYEPAESDVQQRITAKKPSFQMLPNCVLYTVAGCNIDVPAGHTYDFIFSDNDMEISQPTYAIIRSLFALGFKEIGEVPRGWNVTALIEFPNGIPALLERIGPKEKLYLSSKTLWEALMKL